MIRTGQVQNRFNILLLFLAMGAIALTTFGFANMTNEKEQSDEFIDTLENFITFTQDNINIDNDRIQSISKIKTIINRYNRDMSEDIKDNVAFEIYQMSKKYDNLNIDLICATITHESALSWNPKVISRAGALGLMQIMPTTGAFLAESEGIEWTTSEEVLFDPIKNIQLGCKYLSNLVEMFDVEGGLAAYNGGARRAAKWLANNRDYKVLYKETRGYIPAIMKLYERFKELDYVM